MLDMGNILHVPSPWAGTAQSVSKLHEWVSEPDTLRLPRGSTRIWRGDLGFPDAGARRRPVTSAVRSATAVAACPDAAADARGAGDGGHGLRHLLRLLDRLALVPVGRLLLGLLHHDHRPARPVLRLRTGDGG